MQKKIPACAFSVTFNEEKEQFYLVGHGTVRVFDVNTNEKLTTLRLPYANHVYISNKNGVIAVQSTCGVFAFYSLNDFSFIARVKLRGISGTDPKFCYDEDENMLYGIALNGLTHYFCGLSIKTLEYFKILLPEMEREPAYGETPVTRYEFIKYSKGSAYIIRNFYDVGVGLNIYESCYGRYEIEGNSLVLKEKFISTDEKHLEKLDITEPQPYNRFKEFCRKNSIVAGFPKFFRNGDDVYFITSYAIYHETKSGDFEETFSDMFMADYAEYKGRRYICTWEHCLIESI